MIGPDPGVLDAAGRRWHAGEYIARALPDPRDRSRVEFLGKQPHDRLNEWRRRAAVVVVPSRYENFPNTVLEAVALGTPIVAARVGGIPEIVAHRSTGCLFNAEDPRSLADELSWMLDHPDEAAAMGRAARLACEARFAPERVAADSVEFYREVISRHAGAPDRAAGRVAAIP
jgi:glycosyltransferase involved in cell wall biosynthesis